MTEFRIGTKKEEKKKKHEKRSTSGQPLKYFQF